VRRKLEDENHTDDDFDKAKDNVTSNDMRFTDESFTRNTEKKEEFTGDNQSPRSRQPRRPKSMRVKSILKSLGPGVITGASDDDPSGIATFAQAGAQFGFGVLWLAIFQYPIMAAIQEMCARIGLVTGKGIAAVIKSKYSNKVLYPLASLLLIANTINIGADIGAMSASVRLLLPQIPFLLVSVAFAIFMVISEILIPYNRYAKILRYLTVSLFAYIATAVIVGGNWQQILTATITPHIEFNSGFAMIFVAIFGTTTSPYLFFWQASEEAEEDVMKHKIKDIGKGRPKISTKELSLMRTDILIGMAFSHLIMWSIIVTTAGSLHTNGITDIETADQAAEAIKPLVKTFPYAGEMARAIFAIGIIGTGLLAVPVLAGSCGYALADAIGWKEGLGKKFNQAKAFYLVIAASTIVGLGINLAHIDPVKALIYTAVINGVVAVPILFAMMRIANDKKILGNRTNRKLSNVIGWITIFVMGISALIMGIGWFI
jgi:NRAMP (natural resistance-associated macrophage protein)-like metal ion transporter